VRSILHARAAVLAAFTALILYTYWPTLGVLSHKWLNDPQYSHGYLVPAFAAWLLWSRRSLLTSAPLQPSWWGIGLLLASILLRLAGTYLYFDWLDAVSLLPCLAGLFVLWRGRPALRWSWPALAFLLFMIPLPFRFESALAGPLQRIATLTSTYVMQTIGLPALAEGNTILLNQGRIGVVEACSGLSMLMIFFALSTAVALLIKRPLLDKALIVLGAIPIAVIANVARITVTGVAHELLSPEIAHAIFHDWAGWLMMPFALGLLWVELWILSRLIAEPTVSEPLTLAPPKPTQTPVLPAAAATLHRRRHHKHTGKQPRPNSNDAGITTEQANCLGTSGEGKTAFRDAGSPGGAARPSV
jgi:exosortase